MAHFVGARADRPLSVTIIGIAYILAGLVGFVYHFNDLFTDPGLEAVAVASIRLLAVVSGVFMLRARSWARMLAIAWITLHVVISAFHSRVEFGMHGLLLVLIAWLLSRRNAAAYFLSRRTEMPSLSS